jgi:hypothetical protein
MRCHNKVRLQEIELNNKLEEVQNNTRFAKNPFEFIKREVTKGSTNDRIEPKCSVIEAEKFFRDRYSDPNRCEKIQFPGFLDVPTPPTSNITSGVPPVDRFESYIMSRRNKSSPGPDGIPFVVYKKCPQVRQRLICLLRQLWKSGRIPFADKRAIKFLVAKSSSTNVEDFRDITLFNTSLKAITGVWGRLVTDFMTKNQYLDTTIQKGFIPRMSGCIEHNQTLTDIIKENKAAHEEFQLAFLDLENAFGSTKHNLILAAMEWYNIPRHMINLIKELYDECYVVVKTSKWTTSPILIQKGSLQGGPEAGILFNIPWNLFIMGLFRFMLSMGYQKPKKPLSAFADDLTVNTKRIEDLKKILILAEELCSWTKCLKFKDSKSAVLALDQRGQVWDPKLKLNGKTIPSLTSKPFKFLGRWIYPSLKDGESIAAAVRKTKNLLEKTDKLQLDGRKKCWIYQHGILPYLTWDFMMMEFNITAVNNMESCVNRYLKKWLKLTKSADPSILYRGTFGLNITNIRDTVLSARSNTEIVLCISKDATVRKTAKRRRESEYDSSKNNTPKRIRAAVNDIEFQKSFCQFTRSNNDRRGFGKDIAKDKISLNKKSIVTRVKQLSDEERIGKVLSLALQSDWTNWDDLIQVDLKWNEMMYGFSPSMLSFWLNSIQNTLPDPTNLRRWGKQKTADCTLCRWKNCTLIHILCSCKVALEQGRISWRHDSILTAIVRIFKESRQRNRFESHIQSTTSIRFVKKGTKPQKRKQKKHSYWGNHSDWKILMDSRSSQYQVPPSIASTSQRPDICIYSEMAKKVCFVELTSPAEENINFWKLKKREKYVDLVQEAIGNGYSACCRTIEVGARGFVSKHSMNVFAMLGTAPRLREQARRELSKIAIRCSHFLWISRENPTWSHPNRIIK